MEPHPIGTLVRCIGDHGLPLRSQCVEHIWEIASVAVPVDYGCGFIQSARCLVCGGPPSPMVDADFFSIEADGIALAGCMGEIGEKLDWYERVRLDLVRRFKQRNNEAQNSSGWAEASTFVMKDFG